MQNQGSLKTYLYKACPRCGGDLVLDVEEVPRLVQEPRVEYACLQCGRRATIETADAARAAPAVTRAA
jgi:DNA-directed RNA polymerase subunit RPC12/RpoP